MPAAKMIMLEVSTATANRIIDALREKARTDAGHSQGAEKFYHTETLDWHDARLIAAQIREKLIDRKGA